MEKTAQRDEIQTEIERLEEKITSARDGLMKCAEAVHESQALLSALISRRETRRENRQRIEEELTDAQQRLHILEDGFRRSQDYLLSQEELVASAEAALAQARQDAEAAEASAQAADAELEAHKSAVMDAMNRLSAVQNDQTRLKTMRSQMAQRLEELTAAEDGLMAEDERLEKAVEAAAAQVDAEEERHSELADALEGCQAELSAGEKAYEADRSRAEALSVQLQSSASRHNLLTEMTRDMEGYNNAVKRAIQYAKQQRMSGVHGVLAQLMSVPQ